MSRSFALRGLLAFLVVLGAACGGSDERGNTAGSGAGGADGYNSGAGTSGGGGGGGGGGSSVDGEGEEAVCGNGIVEPPEQCDDGNQVDDDGCTNLCEKTCTSDGDCDDLDPCNGMEVCADGVCSPGQGAMADGEQCGDNKECHDGVCLEIECGNAIVQGDEECDDGDADQTNGCTTECLFTCIADDPERDICANDCDLLATCEEATHTCVASEDKLPDGTLCNREQGYCMNGICIDSVCGDGNLEPNEECDDGNTVDGDDCTSLCTLSVCGNGIIDGNEQCDDGKTCINSDDDTLNFTDCTDDPAPCEAANGTCAPANLDGCDFKCKVELTFRGAGMGMSQDPAPEYCVYHDSAKQGNSFAGMFPDPALIDTVNIYMKDMMASGDMGYIFHVMDVDDPVNIVTDPLVRSGMSVAQPDPAADWVNTTDKLDFPFLVYREFYDDLLQPLSISNGKLIVENGRLVMVSAVPSVMGFEAPEGTFIMHDIISHIEIDDPRSKLTPPPESIDSLLLPESVGGAATGEVTGIMCGALAAESFASMGLPQGNVMGLPLPIMEMFCIDQGLSGQFKSCAEGQDPLNGDCSSVLDLMQAGCSATDIFGNTTWYIAPLGEPDADFDGDGVGDGYSMVQKISAQRVKVVGFAEGEPPARPIMP